jgi:hypothetical protein
MRTIVSPSPSTNVVLLAGAPQAELNAISHAIRQALYMRHMFPALGIPTTSPIYIFNDNQGALANVQQRKQPITFTTSS